MTFFHIVLYKRKEKNSIKIKRIKIKRIKIKKNKKEMKM